MLVMANKKTNKITNEAKTKEQLILIPNITPDGQQINSSFMLIEEQRFVVHCHHQEGILAAY